MANLDAYVPRYALAWATEIGGGVTGAHRRVDGTQQARIIEAAKTSPC